MKKMLKKILYALLMLFIILSLFSSVMASNLNTTLNVIQPASETLYLENNQGYLDKKIISSNPEKGEVTIQISLNNFASNNNETTKYDDTEIYILIPENIVNDSEKLTQYITYIETLSTKVFEKSPKTKIGIIGIQGPIRDTTLREDGNLITGTNDESTINGTESNSEIVVGLTNNTSTIKSGLENMNISKVDYYTNLQSAIKLAKSSYSDKVNKILISLYDNVPKTAIGVCHQISYGGLFSQYATAEEAVKGKNQSLVNKTKSEILDLKNSNIDFILLRPDDTSFDQKWYSTSTGELILDFDGSSYVNELYGSLDNPTYGKMYNLNNDNLEKIVTDYIYADIMQEVRVTLKSVVIKDYFPDNILNYFDLNIADSNTSNVDLTHLKTDGYITWNLGDLQSKESSIIEYTLKIKDMKNFELLGKTISTNEKVELTYINYLDTNTSIALTTSPKIQLSEIKEEQNKQDNTIASGILPFAGIMNVIFISFLLILLLGIIAFIKFISYRDVK